MNSMINLIRERGKEYCLHIAFDCLSAKLSHTPIESGNYNSSVWANSEKILVKLKRKIQFVPKGSNFEYDITVNILTSEIFPFDNILYNNNFFIATPDQLQQIRFVESCTGLPYEGYENRIEEEEDKYWVSITNDVSFRHFYLGKITGAQFSLLEGSYEPVRENNVLLMEEDPLIEIK